jgi:hypothetical protein
MHTHRDTERQTAFQNALFCIQGTENVYICQNIEISFFHDYKDFSYILPTWEIKKSQDKTLLCFSQFGTGMILYRPEYLPFTTSNGYLMYTISIALSLFGILN